jgi:hypothetical protein
MSNKFLAGFCLARNKEQVSRRKKKRKSYTCRGSVPDQKPRVVNAPKPGFGRKP